MPWNMQSPAIMLEGSTNPGHLSNLTSDHCHSTTAPRSCPSHTHQALCPQGLGTCYSLGQEDPPPGSFSFPPLQVISHHATVSLSLLTTSCTCVTALCADPLSLVILQLYPPTNLATQLINELNK